MEKIFFVISLFFSLVLISCGVEEPSGGGNAQGGGSHSSVNHEYVDLGLPSGTLWATMNVGASSPEDYGDYFAWGETATKRFCDLETYRWCNGSYQKWTKYCTSSYWGYKGFVDNKTELDLADDAAFVNWGPEWRIPSLDQIIELLDYCTREWVVMYGVNGYLLTSKLNGASLFLPTTGYQYGNSVYYRGTDGYYWSRSLSGSDMFKAHVINFWSVAIYSGSHDRHYGQTVRPVRMSQN